MTRSLLKEALRPQAAPETAVLNPFAVILGLVYGYLPFMVLPLYSTLEKTNWTLLEAAADLGANGFRRFTRVLDETVRCRVCGRGRGSDTRLECRSLDLFR